MITACSLLPLAGRGASLHGVAKSSQGLQTFCSRRETLPDNPQVKFSISSWPQKTVAVAAPPAAAMERLPRAQG